MSKRVLAMALAILAFFIFVGSPFQQAAKAIALTESIFITVLIAALAACGITFVTTGSFGTLEDYISSLFDQYCTERNTTFNDVTRGMNLGSNNVGEILVNNRFVQFLDTFVLWVKAELGLTNNMTKNVVSSNDNIGGLVVYKLPFVIVSNISGGIYYPDHQYTVILGDEDTYLYFTNASSTSYAANLISAHESTVNLKITDHDGRVTNVRQTLTLDQNNGWYRQIGYTYIKRWYTEIENYRVYEPSEVEAYLSSHVISPGATPVDVTTGTIVPPSDDDSYTEGDGAIIDAGAYWGESFVDITDVVIPGAFSDSEIPNISIEYEGEAAVAEQVTDTPASSISSNPSDYQAPGLQSVFPFCIPFDIYAFFECLAAEPEAPSFVWRFYIPGICDEDIEIDLSVYDSAARILRTMELLLFIVGLAFVTRDKFLRG